MDRSEINRRYAEKKRTNHPFKVCCFCKIEKPLNEFDRKGNRLFSQCKSCRSEQYHREGDKNRKRATDYYKDNRQHVLDGVRTRRCNNPAKAIFNSARHRAIRDNIVFDLVESDIVVPLVCPVLGIPLIMGTGCVHNNSPSIDRINPELGYIKDNIIIVSHLANTIKTNASPSQIRMVAEFYENIEKAKGLM